MLGPYLVIGILVLVMILLAVMAIIPKVKKFRIVVQRIEPKKKRRSKPMKKKKKGVWIRVM